MYVHICIHMHTYVSELTAKHPAKWLSDDNSLEKEAQVRVIVHFVRICCMGLAVYVNK